MLFHINIYLSFPTTLFSIKNIFTPPPTIEPFFSRIRHPFSALVFIRHRIKLKLLHLGDPPPRRHTYIRQHAHPANHIPSSHLHPCHTYYLIASDAEQQSKHPPSQPPSEVSDDRSLVARQPVRFDGHV